MGLGAGCRLGAGIRISRVPLCNATQRRGRKGDGTAAKAFSAAHIPQRSPNATTDYGKFDMRLPQEGV